MFELRIMNRQHVMFSYVFKTLDEVFDQIRCYEEKHKSLTLNYFPVYHIIPR